MNHYRSREGPLLITVFIKTFKPIFFKKQSDIFFLIFLDYFNELVLKINFKK